MAMRKLTCTFFICVLASLQIQAQIDQDYSGERDILSLGTGAGVLTFFGDLSSDSELSNYTNVKAGYNFQLERRLGAFFGLQLNGLFGKIAYNEISRDFKNLRNFQSTLSNFNLNFMFHLDNDFMIKRKSQFTPYLMAGVGYSIFDPHGDLKDENGNTYYYWEDGTIRDLPENDPMAGSANRISRDYEYETQLTDSSTNYNRGALSIPLTFGLKLKFTPQLQGRLFASYNPVQSDWMDNVSENDNNDRFLYTGFAINYIIQKKDPNKVSYDDVDFEALDNSDEDGDGVADIYDDCLGTPGGVDVDKHGCPADDDGDGVPNHIDEEPNSEEGAMVDAKGVTVTQQMLDEHYQRYNDSIKTERVDMVTDNPSMESLREIQKQMETDTTKRSAGNKNPIPDEFREADSNNDGFISADEISGAIDGFFEGTNNFTVKRIHQLIDYFFEQ